MHTLLRLSSTLLLAGVLWQPAAFAAGSAAANGLPVDNHTREAGTPLQARGRDHRSEAGTGASRSKPPRYSADTPKQIARNLRIVAHSQLRVPPSFEPSAALNACGRLLYLTTARLRI
jgi:hypothetical protein